MPAIREEESTQTGQLCGLGDRRDTIARPASRSNENKMSDGGRKRTLLGVGVEKSSQKWSAQRSGVRSIVWLGSFQSEEREQPRFRVWNERATEIFPRRGIRALRTGLI